MRFERPPAIEYPEPVSIATGEQFQARIKYFDYGVVSVELKLEFEADWEATGPPVEPLDSGARDRALGPPSWSQPRGTRQRRRCVQPYPTRLSEDYYIIHLREALDENGQPMTAPDMLAKRGEQIAQIVRGESLPLAEAERREVLQSSMSYYPTRPVGRRLGRRAGLRHRRGRRARPSSCSNTPTRSCSSSAITTKC